MERLISLENLVKSATQHGLNFGKSDPYNRLRYYTKIGWMPHMLRKKGDEDGNIKGHYPSWALERLILIEELKNKGHSNDQITKILGKKNRLDGLVVFLKSPETRNKIISYSTLGLVLLILANQMEIINVGSKKSSLLDQASNAQILAPEIQFMDRGTKLIKANEKRVFVESSYIGTGSNVYVTFNTDYSPASRYWVGNKDQGLGFYIELDAPVARDTEFTWWITN